jgi:hypothetical protein
MEGARAVVGNLVRTGSRRGQNRTEEAARSEEGEGAGGRARSTDLAGLP